MSIRDYRDKDARRAYMRDLLRDLRQADPERFRAYRRKAKRRQRLLLEAAEMAEILGVNHERS